MSTVQPLDLPTLAILVSQLLFESNQLIAYVLKRLYSAGLEGGDEVYNPSILLCNNSPPYYYATDSPYAYTTNTGMDLFRSACTHGMLAHAG